MERWTPEVENAKFAQKRADILTGSTKFGKSIPILSFMSSPTSLPEPFDPIRDAYRSLSEGEKARIMRFIARHRFTDEAFEIWLRESGLDRGDLRREMIAERQLPPVRDRLDAAILEPKNERLMRDTLTKYLADSEQDLLKQVVIWVRQNHPDDDREVAVQVKTAFAQGEAPEELDRQAQFELLSSVAQQGWLDARINELAQTIEVPSFEKDEPEVETPSAPDVDLASLAASYSELLAACDEIEGEVVELRLANGLGNLPDLLDRASLLFQTVAEGLARAGAVAGDFSSVQEIRGFLNGESLVETSPVGNDPSSQTAIDDSNEESEEPRGIFKKFS